MTLTDFLLARITEDEAVAKSISLDPDGVARQRFGKPGRAQWLALAVDRPWRDGVSRALAEVVSKRRIVGLHSPTANGDCRLCLVDRYEELAAGNDHDCYHEPLPYPCGTVRALALLYADHPDYDESWRP